MKSFMTAALAASLLAVPPAFADDAHHPESNQPAAKAPRTAPTPRADEQTVKQMQDHMAKMQQLMSQIQKTTDPAERQKLMDEHMKTMRESMVIMHGMGGGMMHGMMGAGMMHGAPKDGAGKAAAPRDGSMRREDRMEMCMDMTEMMMEQMMEHRHMQGGEGK